jgi:3-oxoacyl-[acyl-carrier protein] reductase
MDSMKNSLSDQIAVITGGNTGIGKSISLKFAEEGAIVIILGTNPDTGASTIEEIKSNFPEAKAVFCQVDVSHTAAVEQVMKNIFDEFGRFDVLVNNAGVTADQLLMKMTEEEWDRVIDINLKSCFNTCKPAIRSMMKAKRGKIINISSVIGLVGNPGQVNYAASKAGMIGFTKALAKEVASRGVQVNCVAPGFIQTRMTDKLSDVQKEAIVKNIPLNRLGESVDIANIVWFLASSLSDYVTGQVIAVDGGMTM